MLQIADGLFPSPCTPVLSFEAVCRENQSQQKHWCIQITSRPPKKKENKQTSKPQNTKNPVQTQQLREETEIKLFECVQQLLSCFICVAHTKKKRSHVTTSVILAQYIHYNLSCHGNTSPKLHLALCCHLLDGRRFRLQTRAVHCFLHKDLKLWN